MTQLTLTQEEAVALRDVLSSDVSDLRMEIAATDSLPFRENLKRLKALLVGLVHQLEAALEAPDAAQSGQAAGRSGSRCWVSASGR
jgi:hypothetical protein